MTTYSMLQTAPKATLDTLIRLAGANRRCRMRPGAT